MASENAATTGVTLAARVDPETKKAFFGRCEQYQKNPSDMLREIVVAFNEGRLTISVSSTQLNTIKGLHNHVD